MIGTQIDQDQIEDQLTGHTILVSGIPMTERTNLDFVGAVTVTDIESSDTTQVLIVGEQGPIGPAGALTPIDTETIADKTADGVKIKLMAGQTMNFGDAGYLLSNSKVAIADASQLQTAYCTVLCVEETLNTNDYGEWLLMGLIRDDTWNWTPGLPIYLTVSGLNNATLAQVQPDGANEVIQILGTAAGTNKIMFSPQLIQIEHL